MPCAFLRAAHVRVVERLPFDLIATVCASRGGSLRVLLRLVIKWFSFGILQLLDRLYFDPVLAIVAIARVCEVEWAALSDRSRFLYEYCDGLIIAFKAGVPLKRVLLDGSEYY